jgi:uncharacterized RDD family membrane protein YckC
MNFRRIAPVVGIVVAICAMAPAARAEDWLAIRAITAGSDSGVWVIGASKDQSGRLPILQFWWSGNAAQKSIELRQSELLPAISGEPLFVTADQAALRILYTNLTSGDLFPTKRSTIGAKWIGRLGHPPLAWAGDAAAPVTFALARASSLLPPTTSKLGRPRSELADREPSESSALVLLTLRNGAWHRSDGPPDAKSGSSFWLAARNGTVWLFWKDEGAVRCSVMSGAGWSKAEDVVNAADFKCGFAGASESGPAFIAGRGEANEAVRLYLYLYPATEQRWTEAGFIREGNEAMSLDPARGSVSVGRGQLVVARPATSGAVESGTAPLQRDPSIRFAPLELRRDEPTIEETWGQMLRLAAMLSLLTVVLWFRRQQATTPVRLPPGLKLSAVWRRGLATILDLAPAMIATAPWWLPKLDTMWVSSGFQPTESDVAAFAAKSTGESYASLIIYGVWCLIWERAIGTTPGKLLFGCRVIAADGGKPSFGALLARNIDRVIMMWLGAEGLLVAMMTILVVTRNRQRIGDLIGGTIVVEQDLTPAISESPGPDDDSLI